MAPVKGRFLGARPFTAPRCRSLKIPRQAKGKRQRGDDEWRKLELPPLVYLQLLFTSVTKMEKKTIVSTVVTHFGLCQHRYAKIDED